MIKSKKANVLFELGDGITNLVIVIVGVLIAIAFLVGFNNVFSASSFIPSAAKTFASSGYTAMVTIFNIVMPILYFIIIYLSVLWARKTEDSKIMIFLFWILLISYFGTLMMLPANITEYLSNSSTLISTALNDMPIFNYMLTNSLFFGILYFAVVGVALVTRDRP